MPSHEYHFTTHWRIRGTATEVADLLKDPLDLPRWWPSVYLSAVERAPANAVGVGRRVALHTRGWLPYTLRWELLVVRTDYPHGFAIAATGDFEGTGVWTFSEDGPDVDIRFDWRIRAEKPLLRYLSFALKPVFAANHRWAMQQGLVSLERELGRRRAMPGTGAPKS